MLQNHVLFLIAEQPPADMAGLLALFRSSVPPVVKKRARELLSVIQESVKRGMIVSRVGGQPTELEPLQPVVVEEKMKDVVMLETEMKDLEKGGQNKLIGTSIWGLGALDLSVSLVI